ncbi:MAG: AAA family ATPase [Planctomycetes bacterium]|nr:AAA family ATPase [Planctomycetota bacterium]
MTVIVGQETAKNTLKNALCHGRTHHAWIFQGPTGVGKCTAAVEFARSLLSGEEFGITAGIFQHNDLHVIRKEDASWSKNAALARRKQTNIPVDLLRERMIGGRTGDDRTHDSVAFKTSVSGGHKVFIIDEAELLDETAQNALLKTLEEPPVGTFVILVTSRDDLLLPTIQSRCQTVNFSLLDQHEMNQWLESMDFSVSKSDLEWSVAFSSGSPGDVCVSIETNLPNLAGSLHGFVRGVGGSKVFPEAAALMIHYVESFVKIQLEKNTLCSKEAANRQAFSVVLQLLGMEVRALLGDERDSSSLGIRAAAILADIEGQVRTNISIKVLLESLAVRWVHLCGGDATLVPVSLE